MTKKNKNVVKVENVITSQVDINKVNATQYNVNHDFFNNEVEKVITVNQSLCDKIDIMKMSRIDIFRKAIKLFLTYDEIARIDFKFYKNTNDRSKTRSQDKKDDLMSYCRNNRTSKQLRDVLKEKSTIDFYKTHNLSVSTVSEYKNKITVVLRNMK